MSRSSFYNSPTLCYTTTPLDSNFKYAKLDVEATCNILNMLTINDKKETKKMKAKKCDRCGKLYENPVNGENCGAEVRFRFLPVIDEEDLSEKKIIEKQTKNIYISSLSVDVDICPDCRESFKKWFENG